MRLDEQGYVIRKNRLLPSDAWSILVIEALTNWMQLAFDVLHDPSQNLRWPHHKSVEATRLFKEGHLATRLAILLGLGGRRIFDTLSPWVNAIDSRFRPITGLPRLVMPPLHPLLGPLANDLVIKHELAGRSLAVTRWHPAFSLAEAEVQLLDSVAAANGQVDFEFQACLSVHTGATPWTMLCSPLCPFPDDPSDLFVVVPLTAMRRESGTLSLLPGSHRYGPRRFPEYEELKARKDIRLDPGDIMWARGKLMTAKLSKRKPGQGAIWLVMQFTLTELNQGEESWPGSDDCL